MQAITEQLGDDDLERRVESLIAFDARLRTPYPEEGNEPGLRYDAIVVGARAAGSSTAMLLARTGCACWRSTERRSRRTRSPRTRCRCRRARLSAGDMLGALEDAGTPATRAIRMDTGGVTLEGHFPAFDGCDALFSPRRTLLDTALVTPPARRGQRSARTSPSTRSSSTDGVATGIRGREGVSAPITERARLVIGADGKHSMVAEAVGASELRTEAPPTVAVYTYWGGLPVEGGEIYQRPRRTLALWPTNDGLTLSYMAWPIAAFERVPSRHRGRDQSARSEEAGLGDRVHAAERAERIRTTPDMPNVIRNRTDRGGRSSETPAW